MIPPPWLAFRFFLSQILWINWCFKFYESAYVLHIRFIFHKKPLNKTSMNDCFAWSKKSMNIVSFHCCWGQPNCVSITSTNIFTNCRSEWKTIKMCEIHACICSNDHIFRNVGFENWVKRIHVCTSCNILNRF